VLSRSLAESGHYPAIDVEASISRAMTALIDANQFGSVRRFKQLMSRYQRNRDLISVGAYVPGADPELDLAIRMHPRMEAFLQQDIHERAGYDASIEQLHSLFDRSQHG
jgi:flagellum-specific ATP synthase